MMKFKSLWAALRWHKHHRGRKVTEVDVKSTPRKRKPSRRQRAVAYCLLSLQHAGKMVYTEGPQRSELFGRAPGDFAGAHADCSQFVSAIMHWCGVKTVTNQDFTGTLLQKGRSAKYPATGRIVVFGPGSGVHTGMFTRKVNGEWMLVEFGQQAAPDEISLTASIEYFQRQGHPGVRIRDFF